MKHKMEIRIDQPVRLSVLSGLPQSINAQVTQMDGRNAVLQTPEHIPVGAAIRIDLYDSVLLGEITGCNSQLGQFQTHIHISEAIPTMSDLARLVSALMSTGTSELPGERMAAPQNLASINNGGPCGPPSRLASMLPNKET